MASCRECDLKISKSLEYCPRCGVRDPAGYSAQALAVDRVGGKHSKFVVVFLAACAIPAIVIYAASSGSSRPPQPTEVVRITAEDLKGRYDTNEVSTDLYLKGKIVEVTGFIDSIDKDFLDHMIVRLQTSDRFSTAGMTVNSSELAKVATVALPENDANNRFSNGQRLCPAERQLSTTR